jgi:TonB family protein
MRSSAALSIRFFLAVVFVAVGGGLLAADRDRASEETTPSPAPGRSASQVAYHLRVVRVSGAAAPRGAGLGCKKFCGTPIILPSEEAWGSPEQLAALARVLRGDRADAVTGFLVRADETGEARFEGTVYPGETSLALRFTATAPRESDDPHEIEFVLERPGVPGPPLVEAHVLVHAEGTVAIAAPSPIEGEWVVLAATPMDAATARERIAKVAEILRISSDARMTPPERIKLVSPLYPEVARKERRSGRVVLEAVIDADGIPRAIRVVRVPAGSEDMASSAVEAVQAWRFKPATLDGQPVPVYFAMVVEFALS